MANIPIGTRHEETILVTTKEAIDFTGNENARVLATPHMIAWMERTSRNCVMPFLDAGHDTLGTHVNVSHVAATPIGMGVTFTAEVIAVDGRRLNFRVEARDEKGLIGEGTHERAIVDVAKFAEKVRKKR
jgi:predicted thioesterase